MHAEEIDLLALERQLCFALAVSSRSVIAAYKPVLEPMGLTHPQYLVMLALWGSEPMSLVELADSLRLEPATVSPMVRRLEAAGLVTRERSPRDERNLELRLTAEGSRLRERALEVPGRVVDALGVDAHVLMDLQEQLSVLIDRIAPPKER